MLLDQKNPNSRLFLMDWGSLMLYTCGSSCNESKSEEVFLQYEEEAIKEDEIKKLKKKRKNKKKSEKKSLSKGKSKEINQIEKDMQGKEDGDKPG